jgi:hypothetical protein
LKRLFRTLIFGKLVARNTQIPTNNKIVNFQEAKNLHSSFIDFKILTGFESIKKNESHVFLWMEFML